MNIRRHCVEAGSYRWLLIGSIVFFGLMATQMVAQHTPTAHSGVSSSMDEDAKSKVMTEADSDLTTDLLYRSTLATAEKSLRLQETGDARRWLDLAPRSLRGWEWDYLNAQCDESRATIPLPGPLVTSIDTSPAGDLVAIADTSGGVHLYRWPNFEKARSIGDHADAVYSIAFSPDGNQLVTVSRDVTARVWDVSTGKEIARLNLENPGVAATAFSPSGKRVATCSWMMTGPEDKRTVEGVVWIWDSTSGDVQFKKLVGIKPLDSIAWTPDGQRIAVGSWDGVIHILDAEANELNKLKMPDDGIYNAVIAVSVSNDGQFVAAGSKDRTARVWRMADGKLQATMSGHRGFVNEVQFSADGRHLMTASVDGTIRLWNTQSGDAAQVLRGHTGSVSAFAMAPDGRWLFSAGHDKVVRLWDLTARYGGGMTTKIAAGGTYTTTFSPDGKRLYMGCYDGQVRVLDTLNGAVIDTWQAHDGTCNTLSMSQDGKRLLTCSWDQTARLWNPQDHSRLHTFDAQGGVYDCAISGDGTRVALCVETAIQMWDADRGQQIGVCQGNEAALREVTFSPDGKFIASAGSPDPARVWRVDSQQCLATLESKSFATESVAFSPDGKWIVTGGQGQVAVWDGVTFELQHVTKLGDRSVHQFSFSPDSRRLAVGSDNVYLLDPTRQGVMLRFQPNDDDIYFLSFSPDGRRLATCTTGGSISISHTESAQDRANTNVLERASTDDAFRVQSSLHPHQNQNRDQTWSIENSRIVFSGSRDGIRNLFLFDRSTNTTKSLTSFVASETGANSPEISPDGSQIAFQVASAKNYDLHVMPTVGGDSQALVDHPDFDVSAVWSPDGRQIAFMSTRGFTLGREGPFPGHLYTMDRDGKNLRQVTREPLTSSLGPSDWSPDGSSLLLARQSEDQIDVCSLNLTNREETRLTKTKAKEHSAVFSHDGRRIAYQSEPAVGSGAEIVIQSLDNGDCIRLTKGGFNYYPHWSPDNRWIIYTASDDGENFDIRAVRVEDQRIVELVATEEDEREAVWIP